MDSLRNRVAFKADDDNEEDERMLIMDEEEQEEVIGELREKVMKTKRRFLFHLRILVLLSTLLHSIMLVDPSGLIMGRPITLARSFAFLEMLLHFNLALHLSPGLKATEHIEEMTKAPIPLYSALALSCAAPLLSILSSKEWQQTSVWSITALLLLTVQLTLSWIEVGEEAIKSLEGLKYEAKGA